MARAQITLGGHDWALFTVSSVELLGFLTHLQPTIKNCKQYIIMGIIAWSNFFWVPRQNFAYKNISRPDPKVKILLEIPGELSNIFCKV